MSSAPKYIREAAYERLTEYIRRIKEQVEIEAALSIGETRDTPGLPELLSIVMDDRVPGFLESDMPSSAEQKYMEGYMMSWSLICCHFVDSVTSR